MNFFVIIIFLLLKNTLKVALQYLLNIILLYILALNLKLNFKLKTNPSTRTFENLKEILNKMSVNILFIKLTH